MRPNQTAFKMLLFLRMYLVIEVVLAILVEVVANFSDLAEMSHFTAVDELRLSLWRADLVLEVNLKEIFDAIVATCSLTDATNNTVIPDMVARHLQEVCQFDIHNSNSHPEGCGWTQT